MTAYTATLSWPWLTSRGQIKSHRLLGSSHEVLFPYSASNQSLPNPGLPHPIRSTFRFSQPRSGLLLKLPHGLISYHMHSWDLLFRVFPSNEAPYPRRIRHPLLLHPSSQHKSNLKEPPDSQHPRASQSRQTRSQQAPTLKSVHILHRCYPIQAVDTLMSLLPCLPRSV
jgi:hypothetical protein